MSSNFFDQGSYNISCDRCGQKNKRQYCRKEWNGLLVCAKCYDPKHPWLEPLPIAIDGKPVKDARPRPNAIYIATNYDMGVWGQYYVTRQGIVSDLNWEAWNEYWGGDSAVPFSGSNFPLL